MDEEYEDRTDEEDGEEDESAPSVGSGRGKSRAKASESGKSASAKARRKQRQKERFVSRAWENINRANELIGRQLKRAEEQEEEIDALIAFFEGLPPGEVTEKQRQALIEKVGKLKMEDIKKLTSTLGTLCDKQAQALPDDEGDKTVRVLIDPQLGEYAE